MRVKLEPSAAGIGKGLDVLEAQLKRFGLKQKRISRNMLAAEEIMTALLEHGKEPRSIDLSVRRVMEEITIDIAVAGEPFDFEKSLDLGVELDMEEVGPEAERAIRSSILRSVVDDLKYRSRGGVNMVRITVEKARRAMLYRTLGAMLLAILAGVLLRLFAPESFCAGLSDGVLVPARTMFMNALKMLVTPVVFFSIVSCVSQFTDLSEMGRIGGRVVSIYLMTTVVAAVLGIGMFYLFRPGSGSAAAESAAAAAIASQQVDISVKEMIVNIVPSNFFQPFLEANMLQLIFLAVLCGTAVGMIGRYSQILRDIFTALNELFLKIMGLLVKLMPIATFVSILAMMLQTGLESLLSILSIFGVFALGLLVMMIFYCLLMVIVTGLNPVHFFRKYAPTMVQVFSMASGSASLPLNMDACKRLGVSPKVYSLSLPLGATINMDGTCIYLGVVALALAQICGVEIPAAALLSIGFSIIVLSVGAPSIPGSGLICLSVLLTQIGVPVEALGLVMGIDSLVGMIRCMSNCLGDVAVTCIAAKKEKLLDQAIYKS